MNIKQEILNLKNIINVADLPAAIDQLIADIDASGVLVSQAAMDNAAFEREISAAAARYDFEEVARLQNDGKV